MGQDPELNLRDGPSKPFCLIQPQKIETLRLIALVICMLVVSEAGTSLSSGITTLQNGHRNVTVPFKRKDVFLSAERIIMPILIGLVSAVVAWYFFFYRARNAVHIASDIVDMANDVRLAARRFGFRRQANVHPVESIEDPKVASAAIAIALIELDELPTAELRGRLSAALQKDFVLTSQEAEEMQILGHWLVGQCGGAQGAVSRVGRKLFKLAGKEAFAPLLAILTSVFAKDGTANLGRRQQDALQDLQLIFHIKDR